MSIRRLQLVESDHLLGAADLHRQAVGDQRGAGDAALVVALQGDIRRIDPFLRAARSFAYIKRETARPATIARATAPAAANMVLCLRASF